MKRTMRRFERIDAFRVLLLALLFAGCTVQEGEIPPRRTQEEYAIYSSLSDVRELFAGDMFLAAGLREWMAQTTDEGREAIRKRFFAWGEVVPESERSWTLTGSDIWNSIGFSAGKAEGWRSIVRLVKTNEPSGLLSDFTLMDWGGQIDLAIRYRSGDWFAGETNWKVRFEITPDDVVAAVEGEERFLYWEGLYGHRLHRWEVVANTSDEPIRWQVAARSSTEGRLSLEAICLVPDPMATTSYVMERYLEFEAVQTSSGSVNIIREDLTEEWDL